MNGPEAYYLSEWEIFWARPERQRASLDAVAGREIARVLDVGCGAGQELLPFVKELGAVGAGVDISPDAVRTATRQFSKLGLAESVKFLCCPAESLPFEAGSFDLVTCRLALPYTCNQRALSEMARVLRPGGLLILRIHHARYYLSEFGRNLVRVRARACLHSARVLLAGSLYQLTGRQPTGRILKSEVFQTRRLLRRVLATAGLRICSELRDAPPNPRTPSFLIEKRCPDFP